jgi:hypothetical protein
LFLFLFLFSYACNLFKLFNNTNALLKELNNNKSIMPFVKPSQDFNKVLVATMRKKNNFAKDVYTLAKCLRKTIKDVQPAKYVVIVVVAVVVVATTFRNDIN